jgi:hypothetical protein
VRHQYLDQTEQFDNWLKKLSQVLQLPNINNSDPLLILSFSLPLFVLICCNKEIDLPNPIYVSIPLRTLHRILHSFWTPMYVVDPVHSSHQQRLEELHEQGTPLHCLEIMAKGMSSAARRGIESLLRNTGSISTTILQSSEAQLRLKLCDAINSRSLYLQPVVPLISPRIQPYEPSQEPDFAIVDPSASIILSQNAQSIYNKPHRRAAISSLLLESLQKGHPIAALCLQETHIGRHQILKIMVKKYSST